LAQGSDGLRQSLSVMRCRLGWHVLAGGHVALPPPDWRTGAFPRTGGQSRRRQLQQVSQEKKMQGRAVVPLASRSSDRCSRGRSVYSIPLHLPPSSPRLAIFPRHLSRPAPRRLGCQNIAAILLEGTPTFDTRCSAAAPAGTRSMCRAEVSERALQSTDDNHQHHHQQHPRQALES